MKRHLVTSWWFVGKVMYKIKLCLKAQIQSCLQQFHETFLHPFTIGCRLACIKFSNLHRELYWQSNISHDSTYLKSLYCCFRQVLLEASHYIFIKLLFWCCDCYFEISSFDLSSDSLCCVQTVDFLHLISFWSMSVEKKHSHHIFQRFFYVKQLRSKKSFKVWHMTSDVRIDVIKFRRRMGSE